MNNKEYFQKELCDISKLKSAWILDDPAIHQDITQKLLNELSNEDLENWSIAPFANGTIMLSYNYEDRSFENFVCFFIISQFFWRHIIEITRSISRKIIN